MSSDSGEKDPLVGKDTGDSTNSSTGGGGTGLIRQDSKSYYFAPLKSRQNTMVNKYMHTYIHVHTRHCACIYTCTNLRS